MKARAVGVRILEGSKERIEWHAPGVRGPDYVTLCGMDGDDPEVGQMGMVDAPKGTKIDCEQCLHVWEDVIAMRLRRSDFS